MPTNHCSLQEFATRLRSRSATHETDASRDSRTLSQRSKIEESLAAEAIAKELGLWIPYTEALSLGHPAPSGIENEVYLDTATNTVVKINNLMTSTTILRLLHRLLLHNDIFPQTRYELIGFTGFGQGSIYPVLRQDYVPNATYATHGEILDYMEALGFTPCGEAAFTNGHLTITDLRPRNVLKDNHGAIFVVDADFIEHS